MVIWLNKMAKIIKLEEFLEKHHYNILKATAEALGLNPNSPADIEKIKEIMKKRTKNLISREKYELEQALINALDNSDKDEVERLLNLNETIWENDSMNYVDLLYEYTCRFVITNEVIKNNFMDWLEAKKIEYLIDNDGRFAIKCPTRKMQYLVNRKLEHLINKWDRPSRGKNIDFSKGKPPLGQISQKALNDSLNDDNFLDIFKENNIVQGPWKKEVNKIKINQDKIEPNHAYVALHLSPEQLFKYAYDLFVQKIIIGETGGDLFKALKEVENEIDQPLSDHIKRNIIAKYEKEFGKEFAIQQAFKYRTANRNVLVKNEVMEDEKDSTSFKDTSHSLSPLANGIDSPIDYTSIGTFLHSELESYDPQELVKDLEESENIELAEQLAKILGFNFNFGIWYGETTKVLLFQF